MANIELVNLIPEAPADNGLNLRLLGTILALYEDFEERFQRIETDIILLTENCTSAANLFMPTVGAYFLAWADQSANI